MMQITIPTYTIISSAQALKQLGVHLHKLMLFAAETASLNDKNTFVFQQLF